MKNEHNKMCSLVTNEKINNAWLTMPGADGGLCLYNLTHMTFAPNPTKNHRLSSVAIGRGDATRTRNTWFWRPLLYQLNYSPK